MWPYSARACPIVQECCDFELMFLANGFKLGNHFRATEVSMTMRSAAITNRAHQLYAVPFFLFTIDAFADSADGINHARAGSSCLGNCSGIYFSHTYTIRDSGDKCYPFCANGKTISNCAPMPRSRFFQVRRPLNS